MQHDPLADAMSRLKNAEMSGKPDCVIRPSSRLIGHVLMVMQESNYIKQFEFIDNGKGGMYKVSLSGNINDCGVIKPRYAVKRTELEKYEARYLPAQDFGVLILSTTKGVLSHTNAKEVHTGGKLLAYVY